MNPHKLSPQDAHELAKRLVFAAAAILQNSTPADMPNFWDMLTEDLERATAIVQAQGLRVYSERNPDSTFAQ